MQNQVPQDRMQAIVSLCRRRGFIFQSSEIYGGLNGCWDYGPLGVELKRNIKEAWWRHMVTLRTDVVGMDCSILMKACVWEASGHLKGFSDPMQTCRQCKKLFRADQIAEMLAESVWVKSLAEVCKASQLTDVLTLDIAFLQKWISKEAKEYAPGLGLLRYYSMFFPRLSALDGNQTTLDSLIRLMAYTNPDNSSRPCPNCGGDLTEPRQFNLMFETYMGAVRDEENKTYLRPETCQGIFVNFDNIVNTSRVKVPFGIAQIGKAFRNEINPRNFTFRSREFEQMEMEFFVRPEEAEKWFQYWKEERYQWYLNHGMRKEHLHLREHEKSELAHYAAGCADIEYDFPFGRSELEGIANRTDYDLKRHSECSKKGLSYFDTEKNAHYVPHVIEPSAGADRATLAFLADAYAVEPERAVLRFHPKLAPVKVAVFPLVNKEGMPELSEKIFNELRANWNCFYDDKGAVGRRYRRQDEAGTPFCVTIDGESVTSYTVTVRDRDTMAQDRISIDQLESYLRKKL